MLSGACIFIAGQLPSVVSGSDRAVRLARAVGALLLVLAVAACATPETPAAPAPAGAETAPAPDATVEGAIDEAEAPVGVAPVAADLAATHLEITPEDARLHVEQLASEEMDGRKTGTLGEELATAYVAEVFEDLGLAPAGDDGYFQSFEFTSGVSLGGISAFAVKQGEEELEAELDADWRPLAFSKVGPVGFADVVFAGYGIVAPEYDELPAYDSYGDLDVAGKWVVVLRFLPEEVSAETRQHLNRYASLRYKAAEALERAAAGIVVVTGPNSAVKDELVPLEYDALVAGGSIPAVSISNSLGETLFEAGGRSLAEAQAALDQGEVVPGFELPGSQIGAHLSLVHETSTGRNVLGRLQIGDEPSDEMVVVGAHVDHLGHGEGGDSLARPEELGQIHYGADDNASGVAGLLEIAQLMAEMKDRGELTDARRDLLFAAWSGEELGLLGSSHYVKTFGGESDTETLYPDVAAYLNMDMIGRMRDELVLQGVGSSTVWPEEIEKNNLDVALPVALSDDTYLPTDATSFYLKGVPILNAFTGVHSEYNTPRDTAATLDYESLAKVARLMGLITRSVAAAEGPPDYVKVEAPQPGSGTSERRVYCGSIPDMTQTGGGGVLLSGVSAGGPAEQAGLQAGDVIVEFAGQPIDTLYDYSRVMEGCKVGEEVEIVVLRDGERLVLYITPTSRQ